jgi:hypothetical protein
MFNTQLLLAQSPLLLQFSPFLILQLLLPSHALVPLHTGASSVPLRGIFVHVPVLPA